ncbi:synaptogenesis protein syg-2-like [Ptychodera flava]|uniref:synaptogenesis protein syg-2-like n=1 Tax=Ptychodera flava TaxID=63121 RepID=UPI003969E012
MNHSLWIISSESTLCGKGVPRVGIAKRMADQKPRGIWLFVPVLSAISTASIVEGPVDTLAIAGFDTQLNCTVNDTTAQLVTWRCLECSPQEITFNYVSMDTDKYDVISDGGPLDTYHLRILNTTTLDEGSYQCTVGNADYAAAGITVLTSGPSCGVTPSTFVIEDEEATLTCAVEKGVPPGELVWYREGVAVSRDASTRHELNLVFTREDNGTSFICTLEDETLPTQTEDLMTGADDVVIIVQYKCAVTMIVQPVYNTVEGDDVTIHCSSHDGSPDPYKIGLTFNSEEVIEVYGTDINHTIENILRSQSGTYECFAVTRFYDNSEQHSTALYDML